MDLQGLVGRLSQVQDVLAACLAEKGRVDLGLVGVDGVTWLFVVAAFNESIIKAYLMQLIF